MNVPGLERAGALILVVLGSQAVARWRVARRERAQARLPLFDAVLLEAALAPQPPDDLPTLEALRDVFRRHDRVQNAGALAPALVRHYRAQTETQKATTARALLRLQTSPDAALRLAATDALAGLCVSP